MMRILIVEDEPKVARALVKGLEEQGYQTSTAATGEEGFYQTSTSLFDLVILDLMLPGRDGFQILRDLRGKHDRTPILVLTARDAVEDRVRGLDLGADDYLVKPFAFPELLARIRAITRRTGPEEHLRLTVRDLDMDLTTRTVRRAGRMIDLTGREFQILEYLLRAGGQIVTRAMLSRQIWGETDEIEHNSIDVYMSHLRAKIDHDVDHKLIHTVRGVGYRLGE